MHQAYYPLPPPLSTFHVFYPWAVRPNAAAWFATRIRVRKRLQACSATWWIKQFHNAGVFCMVVSSSQYDWNSRNFVIPRAVNITNVRSVFSTDSEPPTSELGGWISYSLRPRSHVPVFARPDESTTWSFKTSPVLTGRSKEQERCDQAVLYASDLQWIVIQLLLCTCCTVVVNVDVTDCIGFIQ